MSSKVNMQMNQQQIELLDDACARLGEPDRARAVRAALREHGPELLEKAKGKSIKEGGGS
ncbi:MAG: hypothetical protein JJE13_03945 [Thermoleophilia bacterium]|nr:hypothetical protein [Thermoleophilia bacterium]